MTFDERLEIAVSLAAGSQSVAIPGGAVKSIRLALGPYGFEGELAFVVSAEQEADPVLASFTGTDAITLSAQVSSSRKHRDGTAGEALAVKGLVTERSFREWIGADVSGAPVRLRRYHAHFADPAAVLWRQHFPCELTTETTLKAVFEAHKPGGLSLSYSWPVLAEDRPMVFLPLGDEGDGEASFYDWTLWLVDRYQGVFEHDYATGGYRLAATKATDDTPAEADPEALARIELGLPPPLRKSIQLLNASTLSPTPTPVPNPKAVTGVRHDVLVRTPLAAEVARRAILEALRLRAPDDELVLTFAAFPLSALPPGRFLKFADGFSENLRAHGDPFRVVGFWLRADAIDPRPEADLEEPSANYRLAAQAELERASHPVPRLPPFRVPRYPLRVEGKVVSPSGGDDERTWLAIEDEATSMLNYELEIPLWNKKVSAPYEPGPLTGRFFFPAYKHAKVLVALELDRARISRFLDWAQNARLPADGQGNRIVFGKRDKDGTYLEYLYKDQKPALTLERRQGKDLQTLAITEGSIKLTVKEDPTAQKLEPKYDVTMQVEAAKGELSTEVRGGITTLTSKTETAVAGTVGTLNGAIGEVVAAVEQMEADLSGKLDEAKAAIESAVSAVEGALSGVAAKVMEAKSEILSAIAD